MDLKMDFDYFVLKLHYSFHCSSRYES